VISHLKQQLADSKVDTERMAALERSKSTLDEQVKKLTDELHEAKSAHTPVCTSHAHIATPEDIYRVVQKKAILSLLH